MNYKEFCDLKANDFRENMFPKPTSAQEGLDIVMKHLLGDDFYIINPLPNDQANTEVVAEILLNVPSKKFRDYSFYKRWYLKIKCIIKGEQLADYY